MTRSTASGVLPAAESEMIVTALFGYSCASARVEIASSQTHAAELAKLSAAANANVLSARLSMAFPLWIFFDGSRRFVVCRLLLLIVARVGAATKISDRLGNGQNAAPAAVPHYEMGVKPRAKVRRRIVGRSRRVFYQSACANRHAGGAPRDTRDLSHA